MRILRWLSRLTMRPVEHPRAGWEEQFRAMAQAGDDKLLDPDLTGHNKFDKEEWEW